MLLASLAIIFLMIFLLADLEFWPAPLSWVLMPFAVIYGLWWSNGWQIFPFSDEIDSTRAYNLLWDASMLALVFFGTALVWGLYKAIYRAEAVSGPAFSLDGDRLGELLVASKYSEEGKR